MKVSYTLYTSTKLATDVSGLLTESTTSMN